jgi:hypothetical protein
MNKEKIGKIYTDCELPFYWKAYRKDGSILCQFEEKNGVLEENLFTEVDKNPSNFRKFELINIDNDKVYSVDLETGDFSFDGVLIKNNIDLEGNQLQCIFWRRKLHVLNVITNSVSFLHYSLGWQTNVGSNQHKIGINIKREYRIFPDGSVQEILQRQNSKIFAKANIIK